MTQYMKEQHESELQKLREKRWQTRGKRKLKKIILVMKTKPKGIPGLINTQIMPYLKKK